MTESIWTRERRLTLYEDKLRTRLSVHHAGLMAELDNEDWTAAAVSGQCVTTDCIRLQETLRELENVTALVDGMERIEKRMDELQKMAGGGK